MLKHCFQNRQVENAISSRTNGLDYYYGNLILKNGKPDMYLFSGGYYSFDGYNKPECHYYIADYQGNIRQVVNADNNEIEQNTHYYPYGELISDISTNPNVQKYKYGSKELDRSFGLDLYVCYPEKIKKL